MAFWAVEVKPGEPYVHESSRRGRLRITQATLGNFESVGWSTIECSVGCMMPVRLCALNSTSGMYRLDLEYGEEQNVVFSVIGDSSVHLAGYYKVPDAAANLQALVTQSQEAGDREITHVHGIAQEHNALGTEVHNDGTNQIVGQAGFHDAGNVDTLVTQSQEDDDHETTHAHDIAQGHNAVETEVHNDCPNQMVGQSGNIKISDEASLGSGHRVYKEDVGGPINELKIDELKSGDCNAEIAKPQKVITFGAALSSSSSSSAGSKPGVITLSSDDELVEPEASRWKRSSLGGSKPNVINLSSSSDEEQEASSWNMSSSAGSKAGPLVLASSDSDSDGELLANCRKRRPPRNMAWVFSDEVKILNALADERLDSGRLPSSPSAFLDAIRGRVNLKRENATASDVAKKVHNLKDRFKKVIASGGPSGELRDRELYDLSVKVWPELLPSIESISSSSSSSDGTCSH